MTAENIYWGSKVLFYYVLLPVLLASVATGHGDIILVASWGTALAILTGACARIAGGRA